MQFRVLRVVNGALKTFSLHKVITAIAIFFRNVIFIQNVLLPMDRSTICQSS